MNASRRKRRGESVSPSAEVGSEWEFYGVPEGPGGRSSKPSRQRQLGQTQPVAALRETTEGIEILFFPR